MEQLQKASMWKRISAALCDFILLTIVVTGFALLFSVVLGYDNHADRMNGYYRQYEAAFDVKEGMLETITEEEYAKLTETEKANIDAAFAALSADKDAVATYAMLLQLMMLISIFSILLSYLLLEFVVPLLLKNGQTVGKKIFGIAVMREDGVRLTAPLLFARTVLGKCTVETLLPVFVLFLVVMGHSMSIVGLLLVAVLAIAEVVLLICTKARTPIHDMLAHTVAVDMASQRIFDTPADLLAYKLKIHQEAAEQTDY